MKIANSTFTSIMAGMLINVDADMLREEAENSKGLPLQPTSIRYRPKVKAVLDVLSERMGITASEVTNIMLDGLFRSTFFPLLENRAASVYERFQLLMDAHGLGVTDIAALLAPWNVKLSILESRERTMDYLTSDLLTTVAQWFRVSPEWLTGESRFIAPNASYSWYEQVEPEAICRHLVTGCAPAVPLTNGLCLEAENSEEFRDKSRTNEVIFWHTAEESYPRKCGIIIKERRNINGVKFDSVFASYSYYLDDVSKKHIAKLINYCEYASEYKKLTWKAVSIPKQHAFFLSMGELLPIMLLKTIEKSPPWDVSEFLSEENKINSSPLLNKIK
ncbi:hypothetical protein WCT78_00275 [Pectobacterium versatile]|uniref:Conjugal transfer protein TraE n=1 Tax=Pectobacterium brasiliense TaxID=180957 RepID=A0ABS2WZH2_9GAMM|nr:MULTISPECIES: hypothetical protein [Pectobacterium]MBI0473161.1 hypothetical protein [Pectobacterium parmentieri]MBI0495774.1 hypothetical protein [Pectobacterium parmentieri]MBI0570326.1 hypothetical protein [Pectobacterium parmentieri]MBI0575016.1 hypothetical protein [Pectobacterium parmentieri]MBK4824884.1 hypothetical protein [Pectobacterium carotovorum subsp. carotovorum]